MTDRTAIIFGATGLIGKSLTEELCNSGQYDKILVFSRKDVGYKDVRLIDNHVVDFEHPEIFSGEIKGHDLYICLGTTIRKAGSIEKMEKIDRDLPVILAKYAFKNGIKRVAVVSSIGADSSSSNYYLRIKGEMEQGILNIDFETIAIVRPSLLLGERTEQRFGESAAKIFMKVFGIFLFGRFKKYRAIEGRNVAKAMIRILAEYKGEGIFESDQLHKIANRK
jgi:uncharacterized protein YbjT (DUF2867 family)